jgi:hypothetical protein
MKLNIIIKNKHRPGLPETAKDYSQLCFTHRIRYLITGIAPATFEAGTFPGFVVANATIRAVDLTAILCMAVVLPYVVS